MYRPIESENNKIGQSLELLCFALDKVHEAAYLIDKDARFCYVNEESSRALGYPRQELLGLGVADIDPDFPAEHWSAHWVELKEFGSLTFERRHRTKDGRIFPVEISANYFEYDGQGYNLALVQDITERKMAEKELMLSKFMIDNASIAILRGQEDARILYANEQAARMLGYSREELCSMTFFDIVPDMGEQRWKDHRRLLRSKGWRKMEAIHRRKDGSTFPVEVTINYMKFGGEEFSCSFIQDITERKRMENFLCESEERFRTLTEKSPVGVYIIQDDLFRYVNPAFAEIFGYAPEEITDRLGPGDFLASQDRERILDNIQRRMSGEIEFSHHEFHISRKDGSIRVVEVFGSRALHQGRPAIIGTIIDVTERKRSEEKLYQVTEMWERTFNAVPDLIAMIDTDFRFLQVNKAMADRLGCTLQSAKDKSVTRPYTRR